MKQLIDLAAAAAQLSPERRRLVEKLLIEKGIDPSRLPIQRRADLGAPLPLSFSQQRLWFLEQLDPGQTAFHLQAVVLLEGPLDLDALGASFQKLAVRHEALRTVFETNADGEPVQRVLPKVEIPFPLDDGTTDGGAADEGSADEDAGDDDGLERVHALAREEVRRPFDLRHGPLLRGRAIRLGEDRHAVVVTLHHIVGDGWSMGLLIYEMSHLYEAAVQGQVAELPELTIQYPDFALWQRQWLGGAMLEEQIAERVEQLGDTPPVLDLPTAHPRPDLPSARGESREFKVDFGVVALARRSEKGTTPFMVLAAVLSTLLGRLSGQDQLALGFPSAGRDRSEVQGLIGFFINTLVLHGDLRGNPTFTELVERIRRAALDAYAGQHVPFERLVDSLGGERDLRRSPIFQVLLNMLDLEAGRPKPATLGELRLQGLESQQSEAKFDLALHILGVGNTGMNINLIYALDLFDTVWIEHFVRRLQRMARSLSANPEQRIGSVDGLSRAERHQLVSEWNDTQTGPAATGLVAGLVERARAQPTALALAYRRQSDGLAEDWTYGELLARATGMATQLRQHGVGPDTVVAVLAERSASTHGALLGIWLAGGAYLALDPKLPIERQRAMLADAGARWLVASAEQQDRATELAGDPLNLDVLELAPLLANEDATPADLERLLGAVGTRSNLAYVVFTSGSSGRPKGIATARGDVRNHLDTVLRSFGLGPDDRVLQISGLGFDGSVRGSFGALLAGARLDILEDSEAMDPRVLAERLASDRITAILAVVPTLLAAILDEAEAREIRLRDLRRVFVAGEAFPVALWRRARKILGPDAWIVNQYGPTECALTSTYQVVPMTASPGAADTAPDEAQPEAARAGVLLAGRPIGNQRIHCLDAALDPRPQGAVGELFIAGDGLARGYVGQPGRTAESFLPDALGDRPGGRMYRTGDLGQLERDGRLRILGRRDGQVKLRGQRLELGELESVLADHEAVRHAALRLWRQGEAVPGDGGTSTLGTDLLAAYVEMAAETADAGTTNTATTTAETTTTEALPDLEPELRQHLRRHFPESLQPSRITVLEALPRTANGKVDRKALPFPKGARQDGGDSTLLGTTEELLAGIWCELLEVESVGREDNFFDLGGHSLLATRVVSRIAAVCEVDLPLRAVFESPRLRALAAEVDRARDEAAGRSTPPLVAGPRPERIPLSLTQERMWLLWLLEPDRDAFNLRTAMEARGPLRREVLASAFNALVRRHESLRITFEEHAGAPYLRVSDPAPVPLPLVDLRGLPEDQHLPWLRRVIAFETRRPFDLRRGPVMRALLVALEDDRHAIVVTVHHIVGDAWSLGILARELAELYRAGVRNEPSRLPPMPIQYPDFALWQRSWLTGEVVEAQLDYWRRQLEGAPHTALPTDYRRPEAQTFRGEHYDFAVPAEVFAGLRRLGQEEGATLFMTLFAGFMVLLGRTQQAEDLVVGTHIANRTRRETEGLIGFFVNNLVLRTDLSGDPSAREVVRRVRQTCLEAYANQDLPFARLVQELDPERDASRNPFFQLTLVLQNVPLEDVGQTMRESELSLRQLPTASPIAKFDLTLFFFERGDTLRGSFEYNTDLFRRDTVRRLAEQLEALWQGLVEDPEQPISQLSLGADAAVQALENAFTDDLL